MKIQQWGLVNDLLVRWHRWTADPMLSTDHSMREFDSIVGTLWPCQRLTLILEARNLACGAAVWSSVRVRGGREARIRAKKALHRALEASQHQWLGHDVVSYNARGNRIGESNPKAKLTNHEVDLMREMRDEVLPDGRNRYSLSDLADHFHMPKSTVQDICSGRRRAQTPARVKEG